MPPNLVLKVLRDSLNLTQRAMAERLDAKQSQVCQVELGTRAITRKLALAVMDVYGADMKRLGYSLEDLLRGRRRRAA